MKIIRKVLYHSTLYGIKDANSSSVKNFRMNSRISAATRDQFFGESRMFALLIIEGEQACVFLEITRDYGALSIHKQEEKQWQRGRAQPIRESSTTGIEKAEEDAPVGILCQNFSRKRMPVYLTRFNLSCVYFSRLFHRDSLYPFCGSTTMRRLHATGFLINYYWKIPRDRLKRYNARRNILRTCDDPLRSTLSKI